MVQQYEVSVVLAGAVSTTELCEKLGAESAPRLDAMELRRIAEISSEV